MFLWNKYLYSPPLSKELINLPHELQSSIPWKTLILLQISSWIHTFFQIYRAFSKYKFQEECIIVLNFINNYDISVVEACIYSKKSLLFHDGIYNHLFIYGTVIIPREYYKQSILSSQLDLLQELLHKKWSFSLRISAQ